MNDAFKNLFKFGNMAAGIIGQVRNVVASDGNPFTKQDECKLAELCEKDKDLYDKIIITAQNNAKLNKSIEAKLVELTEARKEDAKKIESLVDVLGDFARAMVEMNEKLDKCCGEGCRSHGDNDKHHDELDKTVPDAKK